MLVLNARKVTTFEETKGDNIIKNSGVAIMSPPHRTR